MNAGKSEPIKLGPSSWFRKWNYIASGLFAAVVILVVIMEVFPGDRNALGYPSVFTLLVFFAGTPVLFFNIWTFKTLSVTLHSDALEIQRRRQHFVIRYSDIQAVQPIEGQVPGLRISFKDGRKAVSTSHLLHGTDLILEAIARANPAVCDQATLLKNLRTLHANAYFLDHMATWIKFKLPGPRRLLVVLFTYILLPLGASVLLLYAHEIRPSRFSLLVVQVSLVLNWVIAFSIEQFKYLGVSGKYRRGELSEGTTAKANPEKLRAAEDQASRKILRVYYLLIPIVAWASLESVRSGLLLFSRPAKTREAVMRSLRN